MPLRLIVLGMMGRCPYGGQTWLYLNWLRGLAAAGHDVWYVEDDSVWPYDPERNTVTDDPAYAVRHIATCLDRVGLAGRWAYRLSDRKGACWNLPERQLTDLYRSCDALLNIVGATDLHDQQFAAPFRVYVETDPVTSELRLDQGDPHTARAFADHHAFATYGENYGRPDCGVPLERVTEIFGRKRPRTQHPGDGDPLHSALSTQHSGLILTTRQPVDLALWPMAWDPDARSFTTIGNYRQAGSDVEWRGHTYRWSKHTEWEKFIDLPRRAAQSFEVALNFDRDADRARLEDHGWRTREAFAMSLDAFGAYPDFIRRSRAEFTVAKDQNVRLRSGWFSERDACYLASGKPVVAQDTGGHLPTGQGLFAVHTIDQALAAIDAINTDYRRHCDAARALAHEYFDAAKVARKLLQDLGLA